MTGVGLFLCACVALFSLCAGTTVQKVYFVDDKPLELRPPETQTLTNVLWKFRQIQGTTVLVAEWNKGEEVEYYPIFKESAHLDTATGVLTVKPVNESRAGVYTVEVNQKLLDVNYEATVIEEVPTPKVWIKPGSSEVHRNLSCTGEVTRAEPVSYWWDINANKTWVQMSSDITLQKNDTTQSIKEFSCKVRNPVGEKESTPEPNPFFTQPTDRSGLWALVLLLLLVPLGWGVWFYKGEDIKKMCCPGGEAHSEAYSAVAPGEEAGGGVASGNGATSATPTGVQVEAENVPPTGVEAENVPLREGEA
ncbi:unnamed protein product [Knipowitschia caucasica]|uniref:Ig-like domain-containing protein n=1 Tax=Knipowitschia caucasica TaxID=637954 RepID=A0AAV2JTN6_KNICA